MMHIFHLFKQNQNHLGFFLQKDVNNLNIPCQHTHRVFNKIVVRCHEPKELCITTETIGTGRCFNPKSTGLYSKDSDTTIMYNLFLSICFVKCINE